MEFSRRKTLVTIAVVLTVLLVGEAHVVEGLPAKDVKEPTSKVDKLKEEPQPKEEAAPVEKAAEQGEGGKASDGEEEKKGGEETVNRKDGGDDDGGSADTNGGDDGHGKTALENMENPASTYGEAANGSNISGEDIPLNVTLDQPKTTTNSISTQLTNSSEPGSDGNENGKDKLTDALNTDTSAGSDTMTFDSSSAGNPKL